jgi:hypothetical protein
MDRIDRIGPRDPTWFQPAIDPDREDIGERRRREEERRRRERREPPRPERHEGDDPPHHIDVRA